MENKLPIRRQELPVRDMNDMVRFSDALAKSGMFGLSSPQQGLVMATTMMQTGMTALEFAETYHIIEGRPSKRADAMLASFVTHGGFYEIVERSADAAEIRGVIPGAGAGQARRHAERLSWEECQQEDFPYAKRVDGDGNPVLKANWATPRRRMQMMWARVVSDFCRAIDPSSCQGEYTPEEVVDFPEVRTDDPVGAIEIPVGDVHVVDDPQVAAPEPACPAPEPAAPVASAPTETDVPPCPDFSRIPVGTMMGKLFAEMSDAQLRCVLDKADEYPEIVEGHLAVVREVLASRQEAVAS